MALFKKEKVKDKDGNEVSKKLKDFYDAKAPQPKKFKSLANYCGEEFELHCKFLVTYVRVR
jgi:hypothetical protein